MPLAAVRQTQQNLGETEWNRRLSHTGRFSLRSIGKIDADCGSQSFREHAIICRRVELCFLDNSSSPPSQRDNDNGARADPSTAKGNRRVF